MQRQHRFIGVTIILLFVLTMAGCGLSINKGIRNTMIGYDEMMLELETGSEFCVKHWRFGSGLIIGALEDYPEHTYLITELKEIDKKLFEGRDGTEQLTDYDKGYLMGKKASLFSRTIQDVVLKLVPQLASSTIGMAMLGFLGI